MAKTVILLIGPCSAGKSIILKMLVESAYNVGILRTTSTRPLRENDFISGMVSYEAVSTEQFMELVDNGDMIRYIEYDDNYYGMTKSSVYEVLNDHDVAVIGTNEEGVDSYRQWLEFQGINCVFCFVTPRMLRSTHDIVANLFEIKSRILYDRKDLSVAQSVKRLISAQRCLEWMLENKKLADYSIVTWANDFQTTHLDAMILVSRYTDIRR